MPTYTFKDTNDGREWTEFMSISAREEFLEKNKNVVPVVSSAAIISGVASKPDNGFRDMLRTIKGHHIHSNINTF